MYLVFPIVKRKSNKLNVEKNPVCKLALRKIIVKNKMIKNRKKSFCINI